MKNFERDVIDRLGRMETRLELLQRLVRGGGCGICHQCRNCSRRLVPVTQREIL